ncbi:uncharacterized protein LOC122075302 isoform X2 [Macadamia integrifolia]|uniref:uncharacterized protein LOC122075302 isoform X2 n=1 Tax=Macadamia integrifolia TaxID=60698 RepID=UPI001C4FF00E|nr:uncharacterized protein LOC122075302 isoform X2 [Macadamia integrifolia]
MEVEVSGSKPSSSIDGATKGRRREKMRVKTKDLQDVLEQCQRALELLKNAGDDGVDADGEEEDAGEVTDQDLSSRCGDTETSELCDLLKSRVESPNFLQKLENVQVSVPQNMAEGSSWDMVSANDLWDGANLESDIETDPEGYVLVGQDDIVDGIASFMAAYLLSLKETKDLTPNQLQEALSKTFSVKKTKGKLRRAWDGSKVLYNVASWSATAIGIYQNPALFRAASAAFRTSCRVISRLL